MLYYATRISENIRRREPEGWLICVNVPIARSGIQEYLKEELGQEGDGTVSVYRPEEEVFSKATMSSFEGIPVTNDHPDAEDGVNVDNVQWLGKGHCQNVRRGTGSESNMLIADLVIQDPATIQEILDGKREISCGYNYELCEEDGKFVQRQIRGNHVAIVDRGRAGHRVCIKDSAPKSERREPKMAKVKYHGIMAKMLASFVRDAQPEEIEEAVNAIDDLTTAQEPEEGDTQKKLDTIVDLLQNPQTEKEEEETTTDTEPEEEAEKTPIQGVDGDKLDKVIDLLEQLLKKGVTDEEPKPEVDPLEKLEDDLEELEKTAPEAEEAATDEDEEEEEGFAPDEDPTEPESQFVDPAEIEEQDEDVPEEEEEEEEKPVVDKRACDAMRAAIKAVKPVIAQLPPSQRRAASDAAVASIRKSYGLSDKPARNDYVALKNRKAKAKDSKGNNSVADLGKRIMESRNANYKK